MLSGVGFVWRRFVGMAGGGGCRLCRGRGRRGGGGGGGGRGL